MRAIAKIIPLVGLILLLNSTPSLGAVKAGSKCSKINSNSIVGGYQYTCIKSGKELIWSKGKKVPLKVKPACTQNTIAALQGGARRVSINQSGAQAAWKNYLEFRFLYLENRYVNNSLYQLYLKQANLWYKTAFDNKNSADYLRREFNKLNGLCSGSKVTLPQPLVLNDPMNTLDDWPENPSFVEPDISVTFSKAGALLTCNKPWVKKWNNELVNFGYALYSVGPTNFDMSKISENQMGNGYALWFDRSKNLINQEGNLSLLYSRTVASGQEICGQVLSPPDIPEALKDEHRRDALSIGVWLRIVSPKPTPVVLRDEWWGKLLKIELISNTPFTNKATVFQVKIGAPAPGGGVIGYVASTPQPWGRYIEVQTLPASAIKNRLLATPNFYDFEQSFEDCKDKLIEYNGVGKALLATKQLAELCSEGTGKQSLAHVVFNLSHNGYDDWLLPTEEEVNLILGASKDLKRCFLSFQTDGRPGATIITSSINENYRPYEKKTFALMGVQATERTCKTGEVIREGFSPPTAISNGALMIRYAP